MLEIEIFIWLVTQNFGCLIIQERTCSSILRVMYRMKMRRHYGIVCQKTTACMDRSARVSLCRTSRAVTVANFRADVPAASVIRVVYTSNNLLLTPMTLVIVNIIDVRRERRRMPRNSA